MECDDHIIVPFCFPFFTVVNERSESTTMSVASAKVEDGRGKWALAPG